ncbi:hypothetical protein KIN20_006203 [Parelaphostrongylus tenuis]|uniref:Uncharacterized protein n=1 Tax=Parelaphostrongylus tenuis TaxID=148309 RepID=A0AAD5M5P8_PARTN|nr:hypothetical protein KIN20_006203 [Parelaphostrongylus tenuis]
MSLPSQFYTAFDAVMNFFLKRCRYMSNGRGTARCGVVEFGFCDIVLDFVLLDSFSDIRSPQSAVCSVVLRYGRGVVYPFVDAFVPACLTRLRMPYQISCNRLRRLRGNYATLCSAGTFVQFI